MPVEEIDFEFGHFQKFWTSVTSVLTLSHHRVSVVNLYIHTKFHSNVNTFCGRMDGMADRETLRMALLG